MRAVCITFLIILSVLSSYAQTRTIYYNSQWEIVPKEMASYYRLCQIGNGMGKYFFTGSVEDYSINGKILMKGAYSQSGLKTGDFIFYYPNGQIQFLGKFEDGWPRDIWKHFFKNGKLEHEVDFPAPERFQTIPDFKPITAYDSSGVLVLENGTGHWHYEYEWHGMVDHYIVDGEFKRGWKDGYWTCNLSSGQVLYRETYKNGKFKTGIVSDGEKEEKLTQPVDNKFMLPYKLSVTENFVYQKGTTLDIYPFLDFLPVERKPSETTSKTALDTIPDNEKVFFAVEHQAEFPGGLAAMYKFVQKNLKYPANARRMGIEGNVFVIFLVEKDGSISNVKIQRGINADLDQEAIRIVSMFPKWKPGMQNGKPVKSQFVMPIPFKLDF